MSIFKTSLYCLLLLSLPVTAEDTKLFASGFLDRTSSHQKEEVVSSKPCSKYSGYCSSVIVGGDAALALDYFRSLPDGSWAGNSGAVASLNLAIGFPKGKYGAGAQFGGSYGLYDWDGRGSTTTENSKALQQQGFITLGLFRMTPYCSGFNAGIVYDLMLSKKFGVFALNPILGQLRGQFGYLIKGGNEFGVWSAVSTQTSHKETSEIPIRFRSIRQINAYWIHYFKNLGHIMLWAGTPYCKGLMYSSGTAGTYIFGASFRAPLTRSLSVIGHGSYMGSRSSSTFQESSNYASNVYFGLNYSFGGCQSGQRPYLSLANNSNFMVDTNLNE